MPPLLHNAIRFSGEHGTITLSCRRVDDEVVLEVSDDGAGIPARLLPRIFDSFERFDETLGGMGLGLSIAKSIVEAHGGSINAGSAGLRVLVVEDHHDSAVMLASLLQSAGCRAETAETVEQALQAVMDQEFDLILSDLGLPDGSGYQLMDSLPDDVPVIALSGFGGPQDKKRSADAGFVEHLVKPITLPELKAAIARAAHRSERSRP